MSECVGVIEGDDGPFCATHPTGCPKKVKPKDYEEHRTLEEELHDIVHDLAIGSGLICPSCGKTL